jgi:N-acetylglucosamine-6-phosphate deacetylase
MNSGQLSARLVPTGQPMLVRWTGGVISEVTPDPPPAAGELWAAPPLMDLQINGFAGVDFQQDNVSETSLLHAVTALRAAGCAQFLLTLITDRWEAMLTRLSHLRALRARAPILAGAIAGWHIEGPFLSSQPGFCGAHDPSLMIDPSPQHIRALHQITEADPVLLTLAPERTGALETIALAVSLGMRVSLGHTNASADILRQAVAAGATGFTHFANGCPQELDRHDNILWRVLDTPGLTISLIPDGIHVSAPLFRLAHRWLPFGAIYYTTDAVAPAGAPPGRYTVGRHLVEVGPNQIVRQPGGTNYAGSALTPIDGICRAATMLARPWQTVWGFLSANPTGFMGLPHSLAAGQPADICVLRIKQDASPAVERMIVHGEE